MCLDVLFYFVCISLQIKWNNWILFSPFSDSPPHVPPDELSTDIVIQVISNMTQTIRQHFPNLTVYPAVGNHDYWPQVTLYKIKINPPLSWYKQYLKLYTESSDDFCSTNVRLMHQVLGIKWVAVWSILVYAPIFFAEVNEGSFLIQTMSML